MQRFPEAAGLRESANPSHNLHVHGPKRWSEAFVSRGMFFQSQADIMLALGSCQAHSSPSLLKFRTMPPFGHLLPIVLGEFRRASVPFTHADCPCRGPVRRHEAGFCPLIQGRCAKAVQMFHEIVYREKPKATRTRTGRRTFLPRSHPAELGPAPSCRFQC